MVRVLLLLSMLSLASVAHAADPCPLLSQQVAASDVATRIAANACKENLDWFRPFIDENGRAGGQRVYEAENDRLADGTIAWRKVAGYWAGSGLQGVASNCAGATGLQVATTTCRGFIIDTPWSGAFVSWVMRRAGVPGFRPSAGHIDYVRRAYREPLQSPYQVQAPLSGKPAPGDMLCSVRSSRRAYGFAELADLLSQPDNGGLAMHCDIVVGANPGGLAYLVGGNVQQAVTLRLLRLDPAGYFSALPMRGASDGECSPDTPAMCDSNRQNWAVMLKLKPAGELARLSPAPVPTVIALQAREPERCVITSSGVRVCSAGGAAPAVALEAPPAP